MCCRSILSSGHLAIKATSISRSWSCRIYNACREVYRWSPPHCPPEVGFFSMAPYNKCLSSCFQEINEVVEGSNLYKPSATLEQLVLPEDGMGSLRYLKFIELWSEGFAKSF